MCVIPYHVLHSIDGGGVHDLDLLGLFRRHPVLLPFIVHQLDLTGVGELDRGANGYLELAAFRVVVPHLVALQEEIMQSSNWRCCWGVHLGGGAEKAHCEGGLFCKRTSAAQSGHMFQPLLALSINTFYVTV